MTTAKEWAGLADLAIGASSEASRIYKSQKEAMVKAWQELLSDLPFEKVEEAVRSLAKQKSSLPSVAEIRHTVLSREHPSPSLGWNQMVRRLQEMESGIPYSEDLDPLVTAARQASGILTTTAKDRAAWEAEYARLLNEEGHVAGTDELPLSSGGEEEGGQAVGCEMSSAP